MIPWASFERRWRDALLFAMIPERPSSPLPGLEAVDLTSFWVLYTQRAPGLLRFGLRLSVWALTWAPVLLLWSRRPFHRLPLEAQSRLLDRGANSRSFLLRQLVMTIKLVACFAYFTEPRVRRRLDSGDSP